MPDVVTTQRLEPTSGVETAQMLRWADDQQLAVAIRGNGTKSYWGAPPTRTDVVLSTTRLRSGLDHCAGDLTVTAPAGITLAEVNAQLASEGQWLPLDPWAGGDSTIGGLLATNDSGPRRHRYGAPRDLVIGVEFALVDGRTARAGGRVVKNVAGYDLARLLCGSFGTLAVITTATFKLSPRPPASRTVAITLPTPAALPALLSALAASPLTPSAVEVSSRAPHLLVRFETTEGAAARQAASIVSLAGNAGAEATLLHAAAEDDTWTRHMAAHTVPGTTLVRLSILPAQVATALALIHQHATQSGVRIDVSGRALLGALMVSLDAAPAACADLVARLRQFVAASAGSVAVLAAPDAVRQAVATWDDLGSAAAIMRAVKAQFDPRGTLCPGGGAGGLA